MAPSFRLKLQVAMLALVVGATGATLAVIQQSVAATYRRLFEERFAHDVGVFAALQRARLAAVENRCVGLARSVRLIAAIAERDPALLYRIALDELRDVLRPSPDAPNAVPATFFRFVNADGRVLTPTDERAGLGDGAGAARFEAALARAARNLAGDRQQVGYLAPEVNGQSALHEVVVTPIVDPVTARPLGALAIGFAVHDFGDGLGGIRGGVWLDDRLYSNSIPDAVRPAIADAGEDGRELIVPVDGVPHRVFRHALVSGADFPPAYQVGLYSIAEARARQRRLDAGVLGLGALALLLALVASHVIARSLAVPLAELVTAAGEVGQGNLDVRVPVRTQDEVGRLAASFNEMTSGLAQKERYRTVLNMVADKGVAQQLVDGEIALGGEVRDASVLFCDIRGFTALTEHMAPTDVIDLLNEHMTALTRIVHAHAGIVDKFVGDALLALFGVPRPTGRDADHAVRAARDMIAARRALNATARHPVEIGIGIASGAVVAGCMGSADRLNYTVLGARVNLASRLSAQAGGMEVLIDDTTRERAGDAVAVDAVPALELRGFSAPVAAFRVVDVRPLAAAS